MKITNPIFRFTTYSFSPYVDDMPTDFGKDGFDDDLETRVPGGGSGGLLDLDDEETRIKGNLEYDDIDGEGSHTEFDIPESGTLGLLWVTGGVRRGKIYQIRDGDILGKKEGNLYLDDPKVSTPHCRFRLEKTKFILWDCGSKNGTFVNNKRIRCAIELSENDVIKIGDIQFIFKIMV